MSFLFILLGPGYFMHYHTAKIIIDAYPDIPLVPLEDAYLGIAAAYSGKVQQIQVYDFLAHYVDYNCASVSSYFIHHKVSSKQILDLWNLCVCVLI